MQYPIYINSFNRLDSLRALVQQCARLIDVGLITIVDNASTHPGLRQWFADGMPLHTPRPVQIRLLQLPSNHGPRGALGHVDPTEPYYVLTDPDLDISGCPDDLLLWLRRGLDDYPGYVKAGPSIRLDDIPKGFPFYDRVIREEGKYWERRIGDWYDAAIDTTFAMCRGRTPFAYAPALRGLPPYQMRHVPYYATPETISDEELYYIRNLPKTHKGGLVWSTLLQDSGLFDAALEKKEPR